jgi:hypothetical protein
VREAATGGRLRCLVVDEAHLVTQWGRDFRPEFRYLANLRHELIARAQESGHPGFRTILLSATLGRAELDDLVDLFGDPGPVSLIAANALRAEPDYWIADQSGAPERRLRVLEAISRLPRPLLLYVTRPDEAERWRGELTSAGYGRVGIVTGRTAGDDRRDVLEGLRSGTRKSTFDFVIATSAFGLGIDNEQIRSVVHACLPETIDRWYQEVGRAGRDGHASVALLVPAWRDNEEAASLGIKMLKPDTAFERWQVLWQGRVTNAGGNYIDLHRTPPHVGRGSYNRRWNAQVLRGLEELGRIHRRSLSIDEAAALELQVGTPDDPHEWERTELLRVDVHEEAFFREVWGPWRQALLEASYELLEGMKGVLQHDAKVCDLIAQAYAPGTAIQARFGPAAEYVQPIAGCGRCPGCRAEAIAPVADPPPKVASRWMPEPTPRDRLEALMAACPTANRLSVLYADEPGLVGPTLAALLIRSGVRLVAGTTPTSASTWWCTDSATVSPHDLPPLPALVVPPENQWIDQAWFVSEVRPPDFDGRPVPVVMLVGSETLLGARRDPVKRLRSLDAAVALQLLEGEGP